MIALILVITGLLLLGGDCQPQGYGQSYGPVRRATGYQQSPFYNPQLARAQQQAMGGPQQQGGMQMAAAQPQQMQMGGAPQQVPGMWAQPHAQPAYRQPGGAPPPGYPQMQYIQAQQAQPQQAQPQQQMQWAGAQPGGPPQQPQMQWAGGQLGGAPQPNFGPVSVQQWSNAAQQAAQAQPQQGQQPGGYNIAPSSVVVEQAGPPKVIFMPPEVVYGPPPKELVEQQTKTVLMCMGTPHTITGDQQFYSCCNEKLYYWKTEKCVDGVIKSVNDVATQAVTQPASSSATSSSVTSVNCNGSTFQVSNAERSHYACCGRTLFDTRSSTCNIDASTTTVAPSRQQCPLNFLCCDGYTPIPNGDSRYQCCPGAGPYDTSTQQCVPI